MSEQEPRSKFRSLVPILSVADFSASMAYYLNQLGFEKGWDWGSPPTFGCVRRNDVDIFLAQQGQGQPGMWASLFVSDVDALYRELSERGAKIVREPVDEPWGTREFHVQDLDGHTFRCGQSGSE
jgi:predicted enzyme related to lactoylglutathione lyase